MSVQLPYAATTQPGIHSVNYERPSHLPSKIPSLSVFRKSLYSRSNFCVTCLYLGLPRRCTRWRRRGTPAKTWMRPRPASARVRGGAARAVGVPTPGSAPPWPPPARTQTPSTHGSTRWGALCMSVASPWPHQHYSAIASPWSLQHYSAIASPWPLKHCSAIVSPWPLKHYSAESTGWGAICNQHATPERQLLSTVWPGLLQARDSLTYTCASEAFTLLQPAPFFVCRASCTPFDRRCILQFFGRPWRGTTSGRSPRCVSSG